MAQTPCLLEAVGDSIIYTPVADVAAGAVVLVGTIPMIAPVAIVADTQGVLQTTGMWKVPQKAEIITEGDAVYWDSTGDPYGGTAGSGAATGTGSVYIMGLAAYTTTATDTYVYVLVQGAKRTATIAGAVTVSDIEAEDATLNINGLDAAQGGLINSVAGTSSTAGNAGGANSVAGGVGGSTGAGGLASLVGGASAGAGGTAGAASLDAGAANGGTGAAVDVGGTNATAVNLAAASVPTVVKGPLTQAIGASTAAAGTTTADAGALPAATASVYPTTAADDTKGVVIHDDDKVTGRTLFIGNGVADKILKVYPADGGTINGASADAAFSSVSGKGVTITCLSSGSNTWLAW